MKHLESRVPGGGPPAPIFQHFPQLDGFRGLAISLVIIGHVLDRNFSITTELAPLGVLLFFVLSGFLITGLLDREARLTGSISLLLFKSRWRPGRSGPRLPDSHRGTAEARRALHARTGILARTSTKTGHILDRRIKANRRRGSDTG